MVPLAGIEPALLAELDFESSASTNSATGAMVGQYHAGGEAVNAGVKRRVRSAVGVSKRVGCRYGFGPPALRLERKMPLPARLILARLFDARLAASLLLGAATATIGAALVFEHGFGYRPCALCLWQRWPYYVGVPLAALALMAAASGHARASRALFGSLALVFLVGAGLGAYHAGVEWGFWLGPADCGGGVAPPAASMGDFMRQLETTRVVSCTEAAWRFLGLSMAGWNAVISLALAGFALLAARQAVRRRPATRAQT